MAYPNDVSRVAQGVSNYSASSKDITAGKAAARTLIRETFVLVKAAVDGAASTTTAYTAGYMLRMPRACRVLGAAFLPAGTATADATNNAVVKVVKGDGAAGAEVIVATYTSDVAGGSLAAGVTKALTLSATLANTRIPAGSLLAFSIAKGGTGVAIPAGNFTVDVEWEDVDGYGV